MAGVIAWGVIIGAFFCMPVGALAAAGAFLSAKLGILYPVLCILMGTMVLDYITGMLASKTAYLLHVSIASEDNVWPLVPPGAANEQMLEANS